jgi:cytochrome bd ubiquinol oxidase subunit II
VNLPDLWFVIVAVFWTGFFVLEGFDFGVGALHSMIGRSERERRVAINTIGPFWDGNEVWLVVGGAGIFAAFPAWYATWLSAAYLAVLLLLLALIARGVSFEYRAKGGDRWRSWWSLMLTGGSILAPLVLGIALGDLVAGLPVDGDQEYTGTFWDLFTGFGVWTGLTLLLLCLLHGATFLALRTNGALSGRAQRLAVTLAAVSIPVVLVFGIWMIATADVGWGTYTLLGVVVLSLVVVLVLVRARRDGLAFTATAIAMAASVGSLFVSLYPDVLVSSTSAANSLTVSGSASSDYALKVMTVVAAVFFPLVLLYQGYTYVVFRHRLEGDPTQPLAGAAEKGQPT